MPESTISWTMKSMAGRSISGNISLGIVFEAGKKRVAYPAAKITPFIGIFI
jgi:hypothetical protein